MNFYPAASAETERLSALFNICERPPSDRCIWLVGSDDNNNPHTLTILLNDKDQGLCKIHRILGGTHASLEYAISYLKVKHPETEIAYCTTLSLSIDEQCLTLANGFKLLGVFPGFSGGADPTGLNGLSALYLNPKTLTSARYTAFKQHPRVAPFFELVRSVAALPEQEVATKEEIETEFSSLSLDPPPELELIHAPRFVARKYELTKQRRVLSNQFYPFREPNALLTDPNQNIEVFVRLIPEQKLATIIGERIDEAIHPSELYRQVLALLTTSGITYVEVLIDAADSLGIECMSRAGFSPCVYFPAFRLSGHMRRDFVVFNYVLDRAKIPDPASITESFAPAYGAFLSQYITATKEQN